MKSIQKVHEEHMKSIRFLKDHLQGIVTLCLVFQKKDLYLVITQKLINVKLKTVHFS